MYQANRDDIFMLVVYQSWPCKATSHQLRHVGDEHMQGKPRELQANDDAKAAALMWASEAAFGNTEVAAPKILGDIVESLVGAVYIDSHCNFDRTWQVRPIATTVSVCLPACLPACLHACACLPACLSVCLSDALSFCLFDAMSLILNTVMLSECVPTE